MHLKKLELKGFKSFPSKTEILFDKGITSIVGPNGSGKSNISDAVRWVLGEQSIKNLRGEKLEDVIFAGTDTKKPMNYCEVTLILENSNGEVNLPYTEITIKRRAYRNGESEFFLNGNSCRLKDIKELLLDTGIGKDGYSIIEQGKVDEILSNNPSNRRKIFDEACGIAKYRYKKNEAEKNLKQTADNLERINDIFMEIESQINPLKKQKEKAEKYVSYSGKLKNLEINSIIRGVSDYENNLIDLKYEFEENKKNIEQKDDENEKISTDIEEMTSEIDIITEEVNKGIEYISSLNNLYNQKESGIELLKEKVKNKEREINKKILDIENFKLKNEENTSKLKMFKNTSSESLDKISNMKEELELLNKKQLDSENYLNNLKNNIDSKKDEIIFLLGEKQKLASSMSVFSTNKENLNFTWNDIDKQIDETNSNKEKLNFNKLQLIEKLKNLDDKQINENLKLNKLKSEKKSLEETNIKFDAIINEQNRNIESKKSKYNVYVDMENHNEGFNRGVKAVLNNKSLSGIFGAFGQLIKVDKNYEKAIEASLGFVIQNVVTDNQASAKKAIEYLKQNNLGRVTFLPKDTIKSFKLDLSKIKSSKTPIGIASDLIKYDSKYKNVVESFLGKTVIFDNIDNAIIFAKETFNKYRIVTLDGEILSPGGAMTGGSLKTSGNILSRKRIIDELKVEMTELTVCLEGQKNEKSVIVSNITQKQFEIEMDLEIINRVEKQIILEKNNLLNLEKTVKENDKNILKLENQKDELSIKLEKSVSAININKLDLDKLEKNIEENENEIKQTSDKFEQLSKKNSCENIEINKKKIELVKIIEQNEFVINKIQEIENQIKDNENLSKTSLSEIEEFKVELESFSKQIEIDLLEKQDIDKKVKESIKINENKKQKREQCRILYDEFIVKQRENKRIYMRLKEESFKLNSKIDRNKINKDNLLKDLYEKYELSFVNALEFKNATLIIDEKQIEELKKQIKILGNVNLDSIEKYKELKERYDFYIEQKQDLEQAFDKIEVLIKSLVEQMTIQFNEEFTKITANFVQVYKKLFNGGNAHLKLTDINDVLNCNIEITAQPPGKKMKHLNLLSGGEKALTAICILFAILISRPTPFCILDEIEAPLDDVNIYRFGEFLKELSKETQFITVTHRRGTMEVADFIYGITMQEKGISKILSLKLDEAEKLAE